jgi:hypothetical protein
MYIFSNIVLCKKFCWHFSTDRSHKKALYWPIYTDILYRDISTYSFLDTNIYEKNRKVLVLAVHTSISRRWFKRIKYSYIFRHLATCISTYADPDIFRRICHLWHIPADLSTVSSTHLCKYLHYLNILHFWIYCWMFDTYLEKSLASMTNLPT